MSIVLTVVHVIVCFLLILVILLQAGRGQGLTGASFGGGNVQSLFGPRAADFMTKATTVAAIGFLLTSISLDYLEVRKSRSLMEAPRRVAPLDIDQVKKALEKIQGEAPQDAVAELTEQVEEISGQAEPAVAEAVAETEPLKEQVE